MKSFVEKYVASEVHLSSCYSIAVADENCGNVVIFDIEDIDTFVTEFRKEYLCTPLFEHKLRAFLRDDKRQIWIDPRSCSRYIKLF